MLVSASPAIVVASFASVPVNDDVIHSGPAVPISRADVHGKPTTGLAALAIGATGVVYGDIGTSPLYALRDCFGGEHSVAISQSNVLGILSLMFWSLTAVIAIKYLTFVTRADNEGEGGQFALLARIAPHGMTDHTTRRVAIVMLFLLFGAAILYGDSAITPAISVLSAVEGLAFSPAMEPYIIPITCVILGGLFLAQRYGTARVGKVFGPIMCCWFVTLGVLGAMSIAQNPAVLRAVNPYYAVQFFASNKVEGFLVLGAVVLCITGGEALYADMGHFGRRPIVIAWYALVMPALLVNYFGQGAFLLTHMGSEKIPSPFYSLVPEWAHYPMVGLATMATVIASQAMITGVFSITNQATQLGFFPRVKVIHTSVEHEGQIYLPGMNYALMIASLMLVIGFKRSENMSAAYGLAVMSTMTATSFGFFAVAVMQWKWSLVKALALLCLFLVFDLAFLSACVIKIAAGGWVPLLIGGAMFTVMTTWRRGRQLLGEYMGKMTIPVADLLKEVDITTVPRVPGTAVFLTSSAKGVPPVLRHHLRHNQVLHEQVVLVSIISENLPFVSPRHRIECRELGHGFFRVVARFGFMETPKVPAVLEACAILGMAIDTASTSYYLGRESLLTRNDKNMARWRKRIFAFASRNALAATAYFGIPADRVVEMGMQIEI